ncbi:MAG TPA: hypothetical protein PLL72_09155, partial [Burkholderiaceae bacterium]|nr:hypothetical protein [Burkholderiaceae bacterium]
MRLLISTLGSSGDVLPFVRIAAQMRRRGHEVFLYANPMHEALVAPSGAVFRPVGSAANQLAGQAEARVLGAVEHELDEAVLADVAEALELAGVDQAVDEPAQRARRIGLTRRRRRLEVDAVVADLPVDGIAV